MPLVRVQKLDGSEHLELVSLKETKQACKVESLGLLNPT